VAPSIGPFSKLATKVTKPIIVLSKFLTNTIKKLLLCINKFIYVFEKGRYKMNL
jgi:hypothetical protein